MVRRATSPLDEGLHCVCVFDTPFVSTKYFVKFEHIVFVFLNFLVCYVNCEN